MPPPWPRWSRRWRTRPAARPSTSRPRTRRRPWRPSGRSGNLSSSAANRLQIVLNGVQGMVGDTALVTKAIEGAHHPGRIRARGEEWLAIPLDPEATIPVGTDVVVGGVERGFLLVYASCT